LHICHSFRVILYFTMRLLSSFLLVFTAYFNTILFDCDPHINLLNRTRNIVLSLFGADHYSNFDTRTALAARDTIPIRIQANGNTLEDTVTLYSICENDTVRLSVNEEVFSDSAIFQWSIDGNFLADTTSLTLSDSIMLELLEDFSLNSSNTVVIQVNDGENFATDTLEIVFHSIPQFAFETLAGEPLGDTLIRCINTLPDTLVAQVTGSWEIIPDIQGISRIGNDTLIIGDSIQETDIPLIYEASNGACSVTDTLQIFLDDLLVDIGEDTLSICEDSLSLGSTTVTYIPSGPGRWQQIDANDPVVFTQGDSTFYTTISIDNNAYGIYTFVWRESLGSCIDQDTLTIFFNRPLQAEILTPLASDTSLCQPNLELRALQAPDEDSSRWYVAETGFSELIPDTATHILDLTIEEFGTYTMIWEVSNDACRQAATDTVRIDFIDSQPAEAGPPTDTICGDEYVLQATPVRGRGVWIWDQERVSLSDSLQPDAVATVSASGTYELIWKSGGDICTTLDTINLTFRPIPEADAGNDTTVCAEETVQLGNSADSTILYRWSPVESLDDPNAPNPLATPITNTIYTLLAFDPDSICQTTDEVSVNVIPNNLGIEVIELTYQDVQQTLICGGLSDTLTGSGGTLLLECCPDDEQATVGWSLENIVGEIPVTLDELTGMNTVSQPIQLDPRTQVGKLRYRAWVGFEACPPQDSSCVIDLVIISAPSQINIPGIITPNGDGYNDQWIFENASIQSRYEVKVFNRQGAVVFESNNYQNDWDGGSLPDGVYWYIVDASRDAQGTYKGALFIQRNPR